MENPMRGLCLSVLAAILVAAPAAAQQVEVEEFVLDNGMTFLLLPRYEEPNSISAGWVAKVGSVNERPGITGISHFFEHMMFKGTTTIGTTDAEADADFMRRQKAVKDRINEAIWGGQYERFRLGEIDDPWDPANDTEEIRALRAELKQLMDDHRGVIKKNEFDQIYKGAGATGMNAFTSHDMTFYFINLPSTKFELWAWMESDRLSDSVFREFYAERDVVHEERRMRLESSPTGELDEKFDAMFWQSSPYSWSVIGWPSDLNSYTREQFDDYFNIYYRPNNLVGVIVGDFEPAEIKPVLTEYFGRLKRGERVPPPVVTLEEKQIGEKRMSGECDCQPQIEIRYHTVPFNHRDSFALDMMAELLNGRTGRLYKSMIEGAEIAARASAGQNSRKYAGYFSFGAEVKGDATPADLEAAWYVELERLQTEPVPDLELQKVKNQIAADSYRRLQSNSALRMQLGFYEATGGWEYINDSPRRMQSVTADDIRRVASTYFTPENRSVATYTRRPRAEGETEVEADPLAALPPPVRAQFNTMRERLVTSENVDELNLVIERMEAQFEMTPEQWRPAVTYLMDLIRDRIAELESR
jgi:predicted Zn-dependent peptidase